MLSWDRFSTQELPAVYRNPIFGRRHGARHHSYVCLLERTSLTNHVLANVHNFNLFRRCVQCPNERPQCPPNCAPDESCQLVSASCDACASTICAKTGALPGQLNEPKSSTSAAPIAGGVVGGIAGLAIVSLLLWWFWWRPKRKAAQQWQSEKRSTIAPSQRRSMTSRRSVASTVMSRASNVIQIAYIPGVTVRSPPTSPGLVPPVPALPGASPNPSNNSNEPEQHFFMPSDLRASTWSDASSVNNRISLSPSLARTTYYGGEAEVVPPVPAQHAFRAQANMVSVKSAGNTPALGGKSPAGEQISKMGVAKAVVARPIEIKKQGSNPKVPTLGNLAKRSSLSKKSSTTTEKSVPVFFDEKELVSPIESEKEVVSPTTIDDDPLAVKPKPSFATMQSHRSSSMSGISRIMPADGPLGSGTPNTTHRYSKSEGLNAMIEQALKDAAGSKMKRPELKQQDSGPFSDAHEIEAKENSP